MIERPRALALALCLALAGGVAAQEVPFRTIIVLPAKNNTESNRLSYFAPAWQYLIQERLRLLPGLHTPRLSENPTALGEAMNRRFDPEDAAARDRAAAPFYADLILLPVMAAGAPDWEIGMRVYRPGTAEPVADIPAAKGTDPAVVGDNVLTAALQQALSQPSLALAANPDTAIREDDFRLLASWIYRWPFCDADQGNLPRDGTAKQLADQITKDFLWRSQFSLVVQHAVFCYVAAGDGAAAVRAAQTYAQRRTREARARYLHGVALAGSGDQAAAIEHLTEAANLTKGAVQMVDALAAAYLKRGESDKAVQQYDAALQLWPRVLPFQLKRGEMALAARDYETAIRSYQNAAAVQPPRPQALRGLIDALVAAGRTGEAFGAAQQLSALLPGDAGALLLVAETGLAAGDFAAARAAAQAVVEQDAKSAAGQRLLGQAALALEDYPAAEAALAAAVALEPDRAATYALLADARLLTDNLDGAAEALAAGIGKTNGTEAARLKLALARVEYYRGNWDAGLAQLAEARAALPDDLGSYYLEANLLLYKGDLMPAAQAFLAAFERDADGALAAQTAAELAEAVAAGGAPGLKLGLAMCYHQAAATREARRYYREFLQTQPPAEVAAFVQEQLAALEGR